MALWTCDSFFNESLLILSNYVAIFCVDNTQSSQFSCCFKCLKHCYIIQTKNSFISHEKLKTCNSIFNHFSHLIWSFGIPTGNCSMKCVITIYLWICPSSPSLISNWHCLLWWRDCKIYKRSGSSCNSCLTTCIEIVHSRRSHKRQLHVCMSIDSTGDQEFICTIDDLSVFVWNIVRDFSNFSILN